MHLVIDGYGGDPAKMWDVEAVTRFLADYPSALGMTKLCEPQVVVYNADKNEDSGVSGFVIIAESHISIHTFPYRNYVNMDVFSCRPFDHERALRDVKELFSFKEVKTWILPRGLEYLDGGEVTAHEAEDRPLVRTGLADHDTATAVEEEPPGRLGRDGG